MQGGEAETPILNAEGNVNFTYNPSTPTNENVKVGISTETGYNIKYSIGNAEGEYQDYTEEITVEENAAIYVKLANNRGNTGEVATGNVQNIDKEKPNPFTMEITATTNSITVSGITTDVGSIGTAPSNIGISGYQFKIDNENWTEKQENGTYTFSGLTQGTIHTVQMKAIDLAGNEREATTAEGEIEGEITTEEVINSSGVIGISYSPTTPTNKNVTVTITDNSGESGLTLKYQIGSTTGRWTTYTKPVEMSSNGAIYARLEDSSGQANGYATGNVQNIDKEKPNTFTMEITATTNSITVSGITTDVGSIGTAPSNIGISGYQFKIDNENWTEKQENGTYTFSELTQGTTHTVQMKAIDLAGNEREATTAEGEIEGEITTEEVINSSGVIGISYSPTTPTNKNVTVTITDNSKSGLTLKYQKGSTTGRWTTYTKPVEMSSNGAIYARLEDSSGQANGYATANIQNIDKKVPNSFTPTIETITTNSIVVNASTTDECSSGCSAVNTGIKEYRYYVGGELKYTGLKESVTITGLNNVESHNIYVIAEDFAGNITTSKTVTPYGVAISGYTTQNGADVTWRVFHIDGENIYLVAKDYITYDYIPSSAYGVKPEKGSSLSSVLVNVFDIPNYSVESGYNGTTDILTENVKIKKWISHINYYNSSYANMKATAYLLDTDVWTGFKDTNNKAEYVIGGPTAELYIASYNDTHPERKIEYYMNEFGYGVKWVDEEDAKGYILVNKEIEHSDLYFGRRLTGNTDCWWLASPDFCREECYFNAAVSQGTNLIGSGDLLVVQAAIRPIVCLKDGVVLSRQSDGTYYIQ